MAVDKLGNTEDTPIPAWFLAPYEEKEIRARCQEQANQKCAEPFIAFGKCAEQHQLLFSWKCADLKTTMINCVAKWGAHEIYDDMREKYIMEKKELLREEAAAAKK